MEESLCDLGSWPCGVAPNQVAGLVGLGHLDGATSTDGRDHRYPSPFWPKAFGIAPTLVPPSIFLPPPHPTAEHVVLSFFEARQAPAH